jgi:quinol monooxygenase YgiN
MSQKITVVEKFYPKAENFKEVRDILVTNAPLTKNEIGCEAYRVMINHDKAEELILVENWDTRADYDRHLKSAHVKEAVEKLEGLLAKEMIKDFYQLIK